LICTTPQKVFITGNAGSGKTTLARDLGQRFALPVYSLDQIVWQTGWKKTPIQEKAEQIARLVSKPSWVIDGVSSTAERAADIVIFLDVSPALCTWRCAKRNSRFLFHSRPELPANCPEIAIIPQLLKIIWQFDGRVRPAILNRMDNPKCGQSYFHVQSVEDLQHALSELSTTRLFLKTSPLFG
jgi:thymidylate kinase